MTLFFDSSAVVAANIDGPTRAVVAAALDASEHDSDAWCASALALPESLALIDRLTDEPEVRLALEDSIRAMWDRMHVVPVDETCLDAATHLARTQPVRMSDAIHLCAAARLPAPIRFVTFDARQIVVALSLGFDVVSA